MSTKVYEIITEKILAELEKGVVPWVQPWIGGRAKNLISKKDYTGINTFLLGCQKYSSPYWVSFKQCKDLGGNVKKGEHGSMIVFWKQITVRDKDHQDEEKRIPLLRYYLVWNTEQCEGIDEKKIPQIEANPNFQPIEACEATINGMQNKPAINHEGSAAYYQPSTDNVYMPKKESFQDESFYYSVLFHELAHSTGHEKRLDRKQAFMNNFGSEKYSKEELCAEMTAAFLCNVHQIETTIDNSVAYIQSWLKKLKDDPKMVVLAAAQAQKAADYILNVKHEYN